MSKSFPEWWKHGQKVRTANDGVLTLNIAEDSEYWLTNNAGKEVSVFSMDILGPASVPEACSMTTDITELAQRMKAAAGKATQGEWWADEVKNEGCYGSGDYCVEGFTSYAIYGSDGQTLFDSLNSDAACISEEYDGEGHVAWDETAQRNAEFIALANPVNVLALVEALEKAQQYAKERDEENQDLMLTIGRFRVEREGLEAIRAAAEKLIRCKGRYHSEQNYRALAALFGVTTPDLPPLDSESHTVTVKLPKLKMLEDYLAEVAIEERKQILVGVKLEFHRACVAAGIKVEAE
ncbi:TPA: ead/Ea22-like family protein [Klebsiella pneumoniae]